MTYQFCPHLSVDGHTIKFKYRPKECNGFQSNVKTLA